MGKIGRPQGNRERISIMIDRRLLDRIDKPGPQKNGSRSDRVNELLWRAVVFGPNEQEKCDIFSRWSVFGEALKSLIDK